MSAVMLEAPRDIRAKRKWKSRQRVDGHAEKVHIPERFLQLRFGKEPGDYLILYVPKECWIHRSGEPLPLKDVQFCDSLSVSYHRHKHFDMHLAQEIEVY